MMFTKVTSYRKARLSWPTYSKYRSGRLLIVSNLIHPFSAILHNEAEFENPEKFNPERFMKDGALRTDIIDPFSVATFGFGRRSII
jgi:hypothetical protein